MFCSNLCTQTCLTLFFTIKGNVILVAFKVFFNVRFLYLDLMVSEIG